MSESGSVSDAFAVAAVFAVSVAWAILIAFSEEFPEQLAENPARPANAPPIGLNRRPLAETCEHNHTQPTKQIRRNKRFGKLHLMIV